MSGNVALRPDQGLVAPRNGNAKALLNEILRLLESLASGGEGASIDLRALPLTAADIENLREILGTGAVDAQVDALGESKVRETRFSGVWWVVHCNTAGETVAEQIEVCSVPAILRAPSEDVIDGATRLKQALDQMPRSPQ
jgi:hydrogenase-1 operon protein HyaF